MTLGRGGYREGQNAILQTAGRSTAISFFDTANVYGGRFKLSNEIGGNGRRALTTPPIICYKELGGDAALYPDALQQSFIEEELAASAKRLGVEAIDFGSLHCVPREVLFCWVIFYLEWKTQTEGVIQAFWR